MDHSSIMPDIMQLPEAPAASNSCHWAFSKSGVMGRISKLPLSLVYKPHVCDYRTEYKNKWEKVNRFLKKRWKNINCVKILTKQSF